MVILINQGKLYMNREGKEVSICCRSCGSELKHKQVAKCHVCQSDQTWKRHLGFSTTVLALLTALASVVAVSWEKVEPYLQEEHVFVDVIGVKNSALNIVAINNTRSTVWLKKSVIREDKPKGSITNLIVDSKNHFLKPGTPLYLSAKIGDIDLGPLNGMFQNKNLDEFRSIVKSKLTDIYKSDEKESQCFVELVFTSHKNYEKRKVTDIEKIKVTLDYIQANVLIDKVNDIFGYKSDDNDWLSEDDVIEQTKNLCSQINNETMINVYHELAKIKKSKT